MVNLVVQKLKVAGGLEVLTWGQLKLGLLLLDVLNYASFILSLACEVSR